MFVPLRARSAGDFKKPLRLLATLSALAFVLLLTVPTAGQIRLHDAAKDDLAKKTRDAYNEFTKEDNTVFETMISNTLALKNATLAQLMDLNRQTRRDAVNIIPVSTWKQLRERDVPRTQQQFLDAYNASKLILDPLATSLPSLKAALDDAKAQLAAKTKEKNDKKAALDAEAPTLNQLKDSLDALKDAAVMSEKPIKNLSDLSAQFTNLKTVWAKISEVKNWLDAAENASNAPGLQLTILDLGVQHQQFVVDRLKLEVEQAKAAEARAKRIDDRLQMVWGDGTTVKVTFPNPDGSTRTEDLATQGLFGQIYRGLTPAAHTSADLKYPFVTNENEQVLQTIGRLATRAETEVGDKSPDATLQLRDLMDVLSRYVVLVGYQKYLLLADTIEAGVDANLFSTRLSAINTREREMLVAHGLDGLAAYHAGGLKPEEIANFIRAAQSIALGVLAGRK